MRISPGTHREGHGLLDGLLIDPCFHKRLYPLWGASCKLRNIVSLRTPCIANIGEPVPTGPAALGDRRQA